MATVDKTWKATGTPPDGLTEVGDSAVTFQRDTATRTADGTGSFEFVGGASGTSERGRRSSTGETWETWGVPAGSTVTAIQIIDCYTQHYASGAGKTITITLDVIDSGGTSVCAAGTLFSRTAGPAADGAWVSTGTPGTSRSVDVGKQASTTDVRLQITGTLSGVDPGVDCGIDDILLRITYTAGGGGTVSRPVMVRLQAVNTASGW